MKHFLPVAWWLAATVVIALVLVSLGYPFTDALLLGAMFLPGMLAARYFVPQLSFRNPRQGIFDAVYLALGILCIEYLALMLAGRYILGAGVGQMPGLLLNPVFLLLIPGAFVAPEIMLENYLTARCPYDKTISFVSERRKITLDPAEILYVESNDSEVWLHTASARPTVQRRASRNGNRSSTGASCASTAPISSTRHTSTNTTPRGSTSADRKSKFPANTRTPHGCGSSPLRANNAPQPANGNYCQHIRQCGHFPDGIKPRYLHYGNNEPEKATCRRET